MFYSQFILAKKGPLGTIWIAAHLERKLRKNQVADTDIGVSVDSILFPEAPIALRLSSHLLLGVVRIYSRKVNYLFNDCSETLVKIKQAFHSTAVDLPPEASTAPYHSITLPETFDLDDLELPESSFSHGNFVDHHVTTREQITLQDPVEDTVYLGSQFGLDERFGDGDALQIGLDFDEDLFAEQMSSPGPSSAATHLVEDVLPSVVEAEGRSSIKMEIKGQQSQMPAVDSSHLDEDRTRDLSTMQTLVDNSGNQNEIDFPNVLPSSVVDVECSSSKEVHTPDLNKEILPFSALQGPSTPRLIDETLTDQAEEILNSSTLQKFHKHNSAEGIVPVVTSQMVVSGSYSVSGLPTRLEQVEKTMLSQDNRSVPTTFQFEGRKEADSRNMSMGQVQPVKDYLKEQWLSPQNESILSEAPQPSMTFHTYEDVNLFPSSNSVQEVMMKTSKEVPAVASASESMAPLNCSLPMPTVPPSSVHYELDVSKQQLHVKEIKAPTSSMHSTNTVFREHDVSNSTSVFQQLKEVGDGNKQLHLASGSQGLVQISPMHESQMLNTSVQESSPTMQTFSTCLSGQQFNSSSGLPAIGISGTQQLANHEPPTPANVILHMQEVSPTEFQQLNKFGQSKQQYYLASGSQGLVQISPVHEKQMPNASVQQSGIAMQTFSPSISGQQFNPASSLQSTVAISGTQQLANYEPRASANVLPYMQEVSPVELQQLNNAVASKHQLQSSARSQEYAQVTNAHSSGMDTRVHLHSMAMQTSPISLSGQQFNLNSGKHSAVGISDSQDLPVHTLPTQATTFQNTQDVGTVKNSQHLDQVAGSKQQSCLEAAIQDCAQPKQGENFMIKSTAQESSQPLRVSTPSGEYLNKSFGYQSAVSMSGTRDIPTLGNTSGPAYVSSQEFWSPQRFHVPETSIEVSNIVSTSMPSLHGVQHAASRTGESVSIFPSSDMPRTATNVPESTYPRSSGFSISTAVQGVSKGTPDASILQGISFPLQASTLGTRANVPSRNILQPCSFPNHAGTHGVYTNLPSENMLLQDNYFSKVTESGGFPSNVNASQKSAPAAFQHHVFSNASDELSNALSISHAQHVTASKGDHETMQPHRETLRRSESEIPAHETLRSSYNVGRNGVDIFGLNQPVTEKEAPREVEKFTITSNQSVGRKRHIIDSAPVLGEATPKSRSRLSLSNRSMDYIPHDDDVLASILGRTPSFKIKPTPAETVSAKRRKPTPRRTGLKRKALIDIAMVIHGDVIRQQLANTEDIRRVRKKAPCTPQEIRMIQKESQAHDTFFEPSIPGLCVELRDMYSQVFGLAETKLPQVGKVDNITERQKEKEPTGSLEPSNNSRMVQLEQVERTLGLASEIESRVQKGSNIHVNAMHMDYVYGSRVYKGDGHGKQHDRPLDMVSEMTSSNFRVNNVHDKQDQVKRDELGTAAESARANIYKQQEHERLQKSVSELESIRVHAYDVRQSREQEPQNKVVEAESSQIHRGDGWLQKEQERPWMVVSDIESDRGLSGIESSRVITAAVHEKDQGELQGVVSELESSRAHMLDHTWKQGQEQERPGKSLLETESSRVYAYGVQGKNVSIGALPENSDNVIIGSEVSNVEKTLESSVVPESHDLSNQVFVPRDNTFGVCQVPGLQGMQASLSVLPENPNNVIVGSEFSNVRKTPESSGVLQGHAFAHEIFVMRDDTFGVHQVSGPQGNEVLPENPTRIVIGSEVSSANKTVESSAVPQGPENPNRIVIGSEVSSANKTVESSAVPQGPENLNNVITSSEVSNVGKTLESSGVPQGHAFAHEIFVTQDNTFGVHQVPGSQGKQVSIEALPENPNHIIIGSEVPNVKKTLESSAVPQGHAFVNKVFMSQDNASGVCQVPGPHEKQASLGAFPENPTNAITSSQVSNAVPQLSAFSNEVFAPQNNNFGFPPVPGPQDSSAFEGGFHNSRDFYVASHQFPLKSSCFSENNEMSLEVERGTDVPTEKHGGAVRDIQTSQCFPENRMLNERENILSEAPELAMMKKHGSEYLVGNQVVHAKDRADVEPASNINRIEEESEQRNKEPNFAQDRNEQSQEIAVVGNLPVIGMIEETVSFGSQRQTVWHSAFVPVQGTDSVPNNSVHNGDLGYLNVSGKASPYNFEAENARQDEQVLLYEKSAEMSFNQAEVLGDATLGDREEQDGLNRVDHTAPEDDEDFDFLGDADDTELLQGDINAQDEFDGKSKAPETEENQIQENSGWSARTRAVSRYLKLAFESMDYDIKKSEAENRQNLSLDHLLVGKKRKEAARMFFETLVLKTRDYINVDQKDSYEDIRIHPRAKLMNTNF
ncbi:hypothetical protein SUGI_0253490 [Cryptomeria japonica]|nr:uncharacterized protein LOC131080002 [Cryptomeria japonica]GLJ15441.1 hypothetical protein SUGI_0253490 [Cryptomeria japonica]